MGILVLLLAIVGVVCVAYGLSEIYLPLAPITVGAALLGTALLTARVQARTIR